MAAGCKFNFPLPPDLSHFIKQMLVVDPKNRYSISQLLRHPFIQDNNSLNESSLMSKLSPSIYSALTARPALSQLPGCHPDPSIIALLNRDPFHNTDFANLQHHAIQFVLPDGSYPSATTPQSIFELSGAEKSLAPMAVLSAPSKFAILSNKITMNLNTTVTLAIHYYINCISIFIAIQSTF